MGTWGSGSFDNDDAADFAIEFESEGLLALNNAFDILDEDYLGAPEAQRAIAAAQILVFVLASDDDDIAISPELYDAIQRHESDIRPVMDELKFMALMGLNRIEADQSELKQLWDEHESTGWTDALTSLRTSLAVTSAADDDQDD